jgi:hypothetical protein
MLRNHWELDGNTLITNKNPKNPTPPPPPPNSPKKRKKLGVFGARCKPSMVEQNFSIPNCGHHLFWPWIFLSKESTYSKQNGNFNSYFN